jgi:hypothetical protein
MLRAASLRIGEPRRLITAVVKAWVLAGDVSSMSAVWKYLPLNTDPDHPTLCAECVRIFRTLPTP